MPKERSIPKRLSGSEALDSIMHKVYERLRVHGHFHSHKAYQGYKAKVTVEFAPAMSFSPPLQDDFVIDFGLDLLPEGTEIGPAITETIDIPVAPAEPGTGRVRHGLARADRRERRPDRAVGQAIAVQGQAQAEREEAAGGEHGRSHGSGSESGD